MIAILQAPDDLGCGLAALVLTEELFDVLDLQRALFEGILRNAMLQMVVLFFNQIFAASKL